LIESTIEIIFMNLIPSIFGADASKKYIE